MHFQDRHRIKYVISKVPYWWPIIFPDTTAGAECDMGLEDDFNDEEDAAALQALDAAEESHAGKKAQKVSI